MTVTLSSQTQELLQEQAGRLGQKPDALADALLLGALRAVTLSREAEAGRRSVADVLAEAPGHLVFQTAEEVDAYIREERDSWER